MAGAIRSILVLACAAALCVAIGSPIAKAAPVETTAPAAGMKDAEFEEALRAAMPWPVMALERSHDLDGRRYVMEIGFPPLPGTSTAAVRITVNIRSNASRSEQMEAIEAAASKARAIIAGSERRP